MKIFNPFIVLVVALTACKQPVKKEVVPPVNADSAGLVVKDTLAPLQQHAGATYHSIYSLDISAAEFTGDTSAQIAQTLALITAIDNRAARTPRDTFSVYEKTTEGCAIIVIKDSSGNAAKIYGTLFGETGKVEFNYYLVPGKPKELLATIFIDINYTGNIMQNQTKISSRETTYGMYAGNQLITILNAKKQRQRHSDKELEHAELDALEFFNDYIGQIEVGAKPDRN